MKEITFYEYIMSSGEELSSETIIRNVIKEMPSFPKENYDRKTVESALKKFMGEKYDTYAMDWAWENYCAAKRKARIMNFLGNSKPV